IFYWKHNIKLVVSDIDGTITKSDALGHLFTMVGKDWTHPGVAKLYTDIARNGYHIMYLTSRAIGQADSTRDYLRSVEQGQYQLPDGPVVMSPDRLFTSFHREVILRKPEVFKMACLRDIKRLFNGENPFYAGFGNRITDALSYRSVDVPTSRIFTIDYNGDLRRELLPGFRSSYVSLNDIVDQIFPPVNTKLQDEYNDYNFWKAPLPEIE
ncbi:Lipin/Ned1/Smp2-domain-containing protein, partial [Syncephalis pseudoplumigaleata]